MPSSTQFLEGLRNKRLKWIEANRENNFEQGILNLLTELYPEQAHFIFELFQNAEDALASSITFKLRTDRLIVTHNGKRQFDEKDVESITSIGQSTKKDDLNQIGKFGVGFKAVFSYTSTPIIHSENFNFEIRDLVCPHTVEKPAIKAGYTQFIFPFNNPNKSSKKCFEEVTKGLITLQDNVLLFLNNIYEICWDIEGRGKGRLERNNRGNNLIEIQSEGSNKPLNESSFWLRFQKLIPNKGNLFVGAAFRLDFRDINQPLFPNSSKLNESMKIVPLTEGQLSIYFPAEKEVTKLKFHIHGPYASTVARDSIKCDHEGNLELLRLTSDLIRESLHKIKEHGLLTTDFLAALPNDKDSLDDFYDPMLTSIVNEFKIHKLLPGRYAKFVDAKSAKNGPADIKNTFYDSDLAFFCDDNDAKWVAAAKQKNSRADNFLDSLEIDEWGWDKLNNGLRTKFGAMVHPSTRVWITEKPDEWMQKFYALLETLLQERRHYITGKESWKVVRTFNGEHVKGSEAFFPDGNNGIDLQFPRVKPEVLKGGSKRQIEKAEKLLQQLGVNVVGEKQEIQSILSKFYKLESTDPTEKLHLQHMKRFIGWWKEHRETGIFENYFILRNIEGDYCPPPKVFIDQPYKDTGLKEFYSAFNGDKVQIGVDYTELKGIYEFAVALGVRDKIEIIKIRAFSNPEFIRKLYAPGKRTSYEISEDYTIDNINTYLKKNNKNISLLIWRTVANAPTAVLKARYCPNQQSPYKYSDSQLVQHLKKHAWIPASDYGFYRPTHISQDMLLPEFKNFFLNTNGWLDAIGFGEMSKKQTEEYLRQKEYAEQLGIPLEISDKLKKIPINKRGEFFQRWHEEMDLFFNPPPMEPPPSSPAPNLTRRQQKAIEEAQEAVEKESEEKLRRVRVSQLREIKSYLKEQNTNENGNLICQICNKTMPFKIGGIHGEHYFEAIQFIKSTRKEFRQNHLALCPNCAAEYKYACSTPEQERIELLLGLEESLPEDELIIPLEMPVNRGLRFTQKHLIDLQAAMQQHIQNHDNCSDGDDNAEADEFSEPNELTAKKIHLTPSSGESIVPKHLSKSTIVKTPSSPTVIYKTSPSKQTPTVVQKDITGISDKRVVHAITGITKVNNLEKAAVISKLTEIIKHFFNHEEFSQLLQSEGIHITTLKMATDVLMPGLNIQLLGFKKYLHFVDFVCNSTKCATLYFKTPADIRINKNNSAIIGYSKYDAKTFSLSTSRSTGSPPSKKKAKHVATSSPPSRVSSIKRCKFCNSRPMLGSDVCYSCSN